MISRHVVQINRCLFTVANKTFIESVLTGPKPAEFSTRETEDAIDNYSWHPVLPADALSMADVHRSLAVLGSAVLFLDPDRASFVIRFPALRPAFSD